MTSLTRTNLEHNRYTEGTSTYQREGAEGTPSERIGQSPQEGATGVPLAYHPGFTHGWWVTGLRHNTTLCTATPKRTAHEHNRSRNVPAIITTLSSFTASADTPIRACSKWKWNKQICRRDLCITYSRNVLVRNNRLRGRDWHVISTTPIKQRLIICTNIVNGHGRPRCLVKWRGTQLPLAGKLTRQELGIPTRITSAVSAELKTKHLSSCFLSSVVGTHPDYRAFCTLKLG